MHERRSKQGKFISPFGSAGGRHGSRSEETSLEDTEAKSFASSPEPKSSSSSVASKL